MSSQCIVVNSSAVIALAKINLLDIIADLYKWVIIPSAVYEEVAVRGRGKPGSRELENLVRQNRARLHALRHRAFVEALHDPLGLGEAEAIALALEQNYIVALDDRIARSKARSIGLKVIGTVGLLRRAYDKRLIDKNMLIQALKQLRRHGFRISDDIICEVTERLDDE